MKIGLVRRGFSSTGGAEAYLLRLANGLVQAGHEVVLITSGNWPDKAWPLGEIIRLPGGTPDEFARAFLSRGFPVDVTFSLERVPGCDVYRAGDGVHAAWLRRRAVFEPAWKPWLRRLNPKHAALLRLEREVFQRAKMVIANSRMVADEIAHWHEYPAEKLRIIPNGIGASIPTIPVEEARQRLDIPAGAFCSLFVGTGWERKGLSTAVAAVKALDDAILVVAGRGPRQKYSSGSAIFLGPTGDLTGLFSAADVFVLPTIYDPFSNACLEALAAGLAVITTSANGFSEIITPGVHGDVVPPGDTQATAAALEKWRGRNREETRAACEALAAEYSIQKNVQETLKVLAEVVG